MARPAPTAMACALRWLTVRDRTRSELERRLAARAFSEGEIREALERLRELGYLDDARFARQRTEALLAGGRLGPLGVAVRLAQAGVPPDEAQRALSEAMQSRDELALAREALATRHPGALEVGADVRLRARALRFLLSRGFSSEVASRALGRLEPEA